MNFKDIKTDEQMLEFMEYRYKELRPLFKCITDKMPTEKKVRFYLMKNTSGSDGVCKKHRNPTYYEIGAKRYMFKKTVKELDDLMIHEMAHLALFLDKSLIGEGHITHTHCRCWKKVMLDVTKNKATRFS